MKKALILAAVASFLMTSMAFAFETKSAASSDKSGYTEVQKKRYHKKHRKAHRAHHRAPMAQ